MVTRIPLKIGLFGCGTVGAGVFELLHHSSKAAKYAASGVDAQIVKICVQNLQKERDVPSLDSKQTTFTSKYNDILDDESINCVVELMGGVTDAKDVVFKAIQRGKHVITANKALLANYLPEIMDLLKQQPTVKFGYEAAVCGGIPIIHTLQGDFSSDSITEIAGIMNGTTNYMLSKMEAEGVAYDAVLKEAQDLGFAEADPSADVDGFDVQSKLALLTKLSFGSAVKPSEIPTTGISRITSADFEYAKMMNSTIKLLGVAKRLAPATDSTPQQIAVYVSPVVVSRSNVIASINGATNMVNIWSDNLNSSALVGEGAGRFPTANSVMNDILQLSKNEMTTAPFNSDAPAQLEPNYDAQFFVRMTISDGTGIIKSVGELAEKSGVSIFAVLQAPIVDRSSVQFVVTTDKAKLSQVRLMCDELEKMPFVLEKPLFIPILEEN